MTYVLSLVFIHVVEGIHDMKILENSFAIAKKLSFYLDSPSKVKNKTKGKEKQKTTTTLHSYIIL